MIRVSATQARNNFSHYLNLAAYTGERVIVEKMGKPVAVISMYSDQKGLKGFDVKGALKKIREFSGSGGSAEGVDMKKVFRAMKENYDVKSLLGR